MAKTQEEPMPDPTIVHPEPDTTPTEAKDGEPPPTWQPDGKAQP